MAEHGSEGRLASLAAVLAGGAGTRLGRPKASTPLGGVPLVHRVLTAARGAGLDAVVVAKASSPLPDLDVRVWLEPDSPTHPLAGLVTALEHAEAPLLILACDMPFLDTGFLRWLAGVDAVAAVPVSGGRLHPLCARYTPAALTSLRAALSAGAAVADAVTALGPRLLDEAEIARFGDPERLLMNVNTPQDLQRAEGLLRPL
jgi:molybdenum cofactor guanylyltransferase